MQKTPYPQAGVVWVCFAGDFSPESDVDVLVEFEYGHAPGLAFFSMERELSDILGRKVDLNTANFLSPYFRERILAEAEAQYVAS